MNTPKVRGRKRVRRDRSELYRKVCKLETQLGNEKRRSQRYRKKLQRKTLAEEPTPQKKVRQLLRKCRVTPIVWKTLTFSTALIEETVPNITIPQRKAADYEVGADAREEVQTDCYGAQCSWYSSPDHQ